LRILHKSRSQIQPPREILLFLPIEAATLRLRLLISDHVLHHQ
jgi:hypothetical protein